MSATRTFKLIRPVVTGDPVFRPAVAWLPAELLDRVADMGQAMRAAVRRDRPNVLVPESSVIGAVLLQGLATLTIEGRRLHAQRVHLAIDSYITLYGTGVSRG